MSALRVYLLSAMLSVIVGFVTSPTSQAQIFSIDGGSVSLGAPTFFLADDILVDVAGPPGTPPAIANLGSGLETDGISLGYDPNDFQPFWAVEFSVSPGSIGLPGTAVFSEATAGSGADEPADIYMDTGTGNALIADGDGVANPGLGFVPGGLGLIEPFTSPGDNLDAWDNGFGDDTRPLWFSLDVATAPIPGPFVGGDVLLSLPPYLPAGSVYDTPGVPGLYAAATTLGLDILGAGTDELDALVVFDDGDFAYTAVDIIVFSLAPGSASLAPLSGTPFAGFSGADVFVQVGSGSATALFRPASALGLSGSDNVDALDFVIGQVVPEPGTSALMLLGVGLVSLFRRRFTR